MYRDPKAQKKVYSTQAIQKAIHEIHLNTHVQVSKAALRSVQCVAKTLKKSPTTTAYDDLKREIDLLITIHDHPKYYFDLFMHKYIYQVTNTWFAYIFVYRYT